MNGVAEENFIQCMLHIYSRVSFSLLPTKAILNSNNTKDFTMKNFCSTSGVRWCTYRCWWE